MHPNLQPNRFLPHSPFEEVQFFSNSTIYDKGVSFYNGQFLSPSTGINFEKSATYFESPLVVMRMAALLPNAKIIVLLRDPMLRALSWYQVGVLLFACNCCWRCFWWQDCSSLWCSSISEHINCLQHCISPSLRCWEPVLWMRLLPSLMLHHLSTPHISRLNSTNCIWSVSNLAFTQRIFAVGFITIEPAMWVVDNITSGLCFIWTSLA